jgi:putative ABC transport system permease protein
VARSRSPFASGLSGGGRQAGEGPRAERLRGLLVVSEVALALVLLVGAALMIETLWRLQHADAGFTSDRVVAFKVSLPGAGGMPPRRWRRTYQELLDGLAQLPGIGSVGASLALPLGGPSWSAGLRVEGREFPPRESPNVCWRPVSHGYFSTLGIPLLRGRRFSAADRAGSEPVAIVNATLARTLWPHADPLGRRIATGLDGEKGTWLRIVGVVGDTPQQSVALPVRLEMYRPLDQDSAFDGSALHFVLRHETYAPQAASARSTSAASTEPVEMPDRTERTMANAFHARLRAIAPDAAISDLRPLAKLRQESEAAPNHVGLLLAAAAAMALLLAAIGIYGVLSYLVHQRRHELGIRLTLGSTRRQILLLVLRRALSLVAMGALLGLAGALALTRLLASLLYRVAPTAPLPLLLATLLLVAVAILAATLPALRAARANPLAALRHD